MSCNCTSPAPTHSCAQGTTGLERVNYFPRQIMTVEDMFTEAEYFREKLRRHNRYLHGWGVVCGMDVTAAATDAAPATVLIGSGYALGPFGDEIYVADPGVTLDLSRCGPDATTDPCEPDLLHSRPGVGATVYVAIRYAQCLSKPVRSMPAGCACEEEDCEYSRIRDSFEICCLTELPPDPKLDLLCDLRGKPVPCPLPTVNPWVVLAKVTLPVGGSIMQTGIDTTVRRQLFSTSQIQAQIIECCCDKAPPQPVLVVDNVRFLGISGRAGTITEVFNVARDYKGDLKTQIIISNLAQANAIEVQFGGSVSLDQKSVIKSPPSNVVVQGTSPDITGEAVGDTPKNTITWIALRGKTLMPPGNVFKPDVTYTLTLVADASGTITPIVDTNGNPLDGDVNPSFPSGNKSAGGNFVLKFGFTLIV